MGLTYTLKADSIWFVTEGDVDFVEGFNVLNQGISEAIQSGPETQWHLLFDLRKSTEERSSDELRGIASFIGEKKPSLSGKCALIVTNPYHFGLSRMFGVYVENYGVQMETFDTPEAAHNWLTLP